MKVLIACEESQRVCTAFREKGHEAYSCDIIECSGGHPEWHIKGDVLPLLDGYCEFKTMDGETHYILGRWDMIIAFPPCTYLTITGNRWFNIELYGDKARQRWEDRIEAAAFFMHIVNADCEKIAIENPIGFMSTHYRKPDQIVQPWMFGHGETKSTCLWLKNLPELVPTDIVDGREPKCWKMPQSKERAKKRSKTPTGLAKAMSEQWG